MDNKNYSRLIFIAFIIFSVIYGSSAIALAADREVDVQTIIDSVDKLYRSSSSYADVEKVRQAMLM
jgi:hypothetical protein